MTSDKHVSRRDFLRTTAAAGAAAGLGSLAPGALGAPATTVRAADSNYTGKLVVYGLDTSPPGHGAPKLCADFQKLHPGLTVQYVSFTSERFVALFTAAQASG